MKTKKTGKRLYSTGNPRKKKGIEVRVPAALICCVILTAGCLAGCGGAPKTSTSAASDTPAAPAESGTAEGPAVSEKPADPADSSDRALPGTHLRQQPARKAHPRQSAAQRIHPRQQPAQRTHPRQQPAREAHLRQQPAQTAKQPGAGC